MFNRGGLPWPSARGASEAGLVQAYLTACLVFLFDGSCGVPETERPLCPSVQRH